MSTKALLFRASMLAMAATPALASSATDDLNVTATLSASCTVTGGTLAFGTISNTQAVTDASTTISVTCTAGAPYTLVLGAGQGPGATVTARAMTGFNLSGSLAYALYANPGRTNPFNATTYMGSGTGSAGTTQVYGRIPIQPTPAADAYSDVLVITVGY